MFDKYAEKKEPWWTQKRLVITILATLAGVLFATWAFPASAQELGDFPTIPCPPETMCEKIVQAQGNAVIEKMKLEIKELEIKLQQMKGKAFAKAARFRSTHVGSAAGGGTSSSTE